MAHKEMDNTIIRNRKARYEYFVEDQLEVGIVLAGWEVKGLRAGRANLNDSYVLIKNNEAWLLGLHISPLPTTAKYIKADPTRTRKLLLHRKQIDRLQGSIERKGYTVVPLAMYWQRGRAKLNIALVKGKQQHDKRATEKNRDWQREKSRLMKH